MKGRARIFGHLKTWAYDLPMVFIGHSIQDPDLRAVLLELTTLGEKRPRYYMVVPKVDDIQRRFWETKKITPLQGTFTEFLEDLGNKIPPQFRGLGIQVAQLPHPVLKRAKVSNPTLTAICEQFLENDVEYVNGVTATEHLIAKDFYKGINPGWAAIEQNLDARRHLTDTLLSDHFLINESDHRRSAELILIKAHAGAGKTVLLKRLAWDARA